MKFITLNEYKHPIQLGGRGDWSNEGCSNATMNDEFRDQDVVICKCNHLSTFGIFVVSILILRSIILKYFTLI